MKTRDARQGQRAPVGAPPAALPAIKQTEVDERMSSPTPTCVAVIEKMIKQRRDSIAQFEKAARKDLADEEKFEIGVLLSATCRSR